MKVKASSVENFLSRFGARVMLATMPDGNVIVRYRRWAHRSVLVAFTIRRCHDELRYDHAISPDQQPNPERRRWRPPTVMRSPATAVDSGEKLCIPQTPPNYGKEPMTCGTPRGDAP
jgi:hypothetical protein